MYEIRYGRVKWGPGNPRSRTSAGNWKLPLKWNREADAAGVRKSVFCASLADWLDHEVPPIWRSDLVNLIEATPNLDWQLLTKRPEGWKARLMEIRETAPLAARWLDGQAPANVWVGTSAEDQQRWDERVPALMTIPAKVRFVSAEPLLGPITMGALRPDWLIVGGESGHGARPMDGAWVRSLRDQCDERTAFLFKQWGGNTATKKRAGRLLDGQTWDGRPE